MQRKHKRFVEKHEDDCPQAQQKMRQDENINEARKRKNTELNANTALPDRKKSASLILVLRADKLLLTCFQKQIKRLQITFRHISYKIEIVALHNFAG